MCLFSLLDPFTFGLSSLKCPQTYLSLSLITCFSIKTLLSQVKVHTFARGEAGHPLAHVVAGAPQLADVGLQLLHLNLLKNEQNEKTNTEQRS